MNLQGISEIIIAEYSIPEQSQIFRKTSENSKTFQKIVE